MRPPLGWGGRGGGWGLARCWKATSSPVQRLPWCKYWLGERPVRILVRNRGVEVYQKHDATNWPMSAARQVVAGTLVAILISMAIAASGCSSSAGQPAASTTSSTTQQPVGTTKPTGATAATAAQPRSTQAAAKPDFPPAVAPSRLEHGGTYWGVYVTVVRADDNYQVKPEDKNRLDAAKKSLTDLGYEPDAGAYDIGCEDGVREQLRLDPRRIYATVRIFFTKQAQAQQFVNAYQPGVVGTAKVTLYCMD